ncbi:acetyl/propionyl/methylcrotonyl-CoA carboxylase subunit alpha [Ferrimonas sediminicola]|uniref:Biotin carboxylase n=1 Tax=Ferrimonas sediminicola TaxID=2569538 RepID=A0A4U1BEW3_9GAMM|nr:acetyl/propionyl/methylcrotonyl-CoA carboxylase subunit alpha [Ferrimonas sediminicola]TKB49774.1 acetyl/propionyl/methylcrotonyl-CoA carboxylase subunit alpha [Ferrimonas sediminicola]
MLTKVLIANRGEIACRVIRTCRTLGIATVAVYSEADRGAQHVLMADEALLLGPAPATESYLKGEAILELARAHGVDGIHPGYGFLSENPQFARGCEAAGIRFIGPGADAIDKMGSKSAAKAIMADAGVPMLPGYHGEDQSDACLTAEASKIGYPLLVKAAFGGGGKGMRIVNGADELPQALATARREAASAFGNDTLLLERYLAAPRHVEVQVFADTQGNCIYLSDRDCSIQRRHQKVVEEAPAPGLSDALRAEMGQAACRAAQAIDYVGAGTVEFLLDEQGRFYFMEMNTRLQVEHPVTEMVTGQDLVEWQLRVAAGDPLPLSQSQITVKGHSLEVRLYAEDPQREFLPATGTLTRFRVPDSLRLDSGVITGDTISAHYDPMIAKLISYGEDRNQAIAQMVRGLRQTQLAGVTSNLAFLARIVAHEDFRRAKLDTGFIERHYHTLTKADDLRQRAAIAAALVASRPKPGQVPWQSAVGFRLNQAAHLGHQLEDEHGERYTLELRGLWPTFRVQLDGQEHRVVASLDDEQVRLELDGHLCHWPYQRCHEAVTLFLPDGPLRFTQVRHGSSEEGEAGEDALKAPMNGTIVALLCDLEQQVEAGQSLLVMEAMKMEYTITAPYAGKVTALPFSPGQQVNDGAALVALEALEE